MLSWCTAQSYSQPVNFHPSYWSRVLTLTGQLVLDVCHCGLEEGNHECFEKREQLQHFDE